LGERLLCKQEVDGSIPFTSTKPQREALSAAASGVTLVTPKAKRNAQRCRWPRKAQRKLRRKRHRAEQNAPRERRQGSGRQTICRRHQTRRIVL
jgi:hypothetical protein